MTGRPIDAARTEGEADRPLRDLLLLMPHLPLGPDFNIDYAGAEPALLSQIGAHADLTMRTLHRGTAAIGQLLVYVSPEIGTGEFSADAMEGLGWLLAEMGDLAATAHLIAASCQRFTADYSPRTPKRIPCARP